MPPPPPIRHIHSCFVSDHASVPLRELIPATHNVMKRENVRAKGMSSAPNVHSATLASMAWRALTHTDADSVSVMDTVECVKQLMVILDGTFQTSSHRV